MSLAGMLSVKELRKLFSEDGKDALKERYQGSSYFLLVLSDGLSTHVTWTPPGTDTEEFIYTRETPSDFEEPEDVDVVSEEPKTTRSVKRSYSSQTPAEPSLIDSASLIVPLVDKSTIIGVGRGGLSDLKLTSTSVSAIHAAFIKSHDGWGLTDRGSKNGTLLDGVLLEENKLYPTIAPGREIAFADVRCVFLDIWGLLDVCEL